MPHKTADMHKRISTVFLLALIFAPHDLQAQESKNQVFVEITDEFFNPDYLEIQTGTTVVWVNKGEREHWPASDFHPTHTMYPTKEEGCIGSNFDACRGLEPGESYSFTFDKPGNWGLHDHLFPGLTMRLEISGEDLSSLNQDASKSIFQKIADAFNSAWNWMRNFFVGIPAGDRTSAAEVEEFKKLPFSRQDVYIKDLAKENPGKAWSFLKSAFITNGEVVGNVHQYAHIIGNEAYKKHGFSEIKICTPEFAYGCFHGVTEKMLQVEGPSVVPKIEKECLSMFPPDKTMDYTGCIHGTGHGLFSWAGFDMAKALELCNQFGSQYKNFCYDGAFMEHSFSAVKSELDLGNPWNFCLELDPQYHHNCARYQVQLFQSAFGLDMKQTMEMCDSAPTQELKTTCQEDFGYMAAQIAKTDFEKGRQLCSLSSEAEGKYRCMVGIATELVFQEYSSWREASAEICKSMPPEWEKTCLERRENTAKAYGRNL